MEMRISWLALGRPDCTEWFAPVFLVQRNRVGFETANCAWDGNPPLSWSSTTPVCVVRNRRRRYTRPSESFRERDNASSVDEQPKSPRDARASVSERFDIIRDHTTNHTTTSTPNNTSLTQGFSVERHWSLSDKPKRARMRESPLQIHTQGQSCCVSEHFLSTRGEMQTKGLPVSRHDHHDHGTARTPFAPWPKRSCKMELRVESLKLVLLHG